jgi:hypothetical protein
MWYALEYSIYEVSKQQWGKAKNNYYIKVLLKIFCESKTGHEETEELYLRILTGQVKGLFFLSIFLWLSYTQDHLVIR